MPVGDLAAALLRLKEKRPGGRGQRSARLLAVAVVLSPLREGGI